MTEIEFFILECIKELQGLVIRKDITTRIVYKKGLGCAKLEIIDL